MKPILQVFDGPVGSLTVVSHGAAGHALSAEIIQRLEGAVKIVEGDMLERGGTLVALVELKD